MILCVAELLERSKKGRKITRCCQGVRHRSQRCFHGCGSHFKTTGMCSRRHGGGRVRSTTPAENRYYRPISKKEQAHHSSAGGKSVSCCLRKADFPKTVARAFERRRSTRTPDMLCVSH
ncbi:hypothetical protein TNCV_382851 [Trichonephila clavipes]|nr:hypothetical protein TNCV_382851 [Trichonephila clavipes]